MALARQRRTPSDGAWARTALGFLLLFFFFLLFLFFFPFSPLIDRRRPKSTIDGRFLPQSAADDRNRPSIVDFWRYRPVAGGPRTDNLVD
ncbi:hypothetical protein GW17_00000654 [Ensete ventricosum]|nr:hypothetical protein GW17_00000654 [Ensete ventricosum]RZS02520.1 hypothetical protein BHM03_00032573 [Ensete ventricosum]